MAERLQKLLAQSGVASRRHAEALIRQERVRLNGAIAQLGDQADPRRDRIEVDGQPLRRRAAPATWLLHKPLGYVSTCDDPRGRRTVLDLLPPELRHGQGMHPVGRLDTDSSGALLLTNDGELTFRLTHPRHHIPKTYRVWVEGRPSRATLRRWAEGVPLDGTPTLPAGVEVIEHDRERTCLRIILEEGRNRQIRRMAEALGHPVLQLHRLAIGPITLADLPRGHSRALSPDELRRLARLCQD